MDNKFVVKLEENEDGELILPLSEEIIQLLDWQEGDTLEFVEDIYCDAFYIRKVD